MSETFESTTDTQEEKTFVLPCDAKDDELKEEFVEEQNVITGNELKSKLNTVDTCYGESSKSGLTVVRNETELLNEIYSSGQDHKVPVCTECQVTRRDPTPAELTMCLHAAVYKVRFCCVKNENAHLLTRNEESSLWNSF